MDLEWFTTTQAANLLEISTGRVRQLVVKYKENETFVKQDSGRNLVSNLFIDNHAQNKQQNPINTPSATSVATSTNNDASDTILEDLGTGLHISPNGNHIQVFTQEEYRSFHEQLIEARHLALRLAEEKERTKFLEDLTEKQSDILAQALESLNKAHQHLSQRQFIEAKEKGLG